MEVSDPDISHGGQGVSDPTKVEGSGEEYTIIKPKLKCVSSKIGGGVRVRPAPSCEVKYALYLLMWLLRFTCIHHVHVPLSTQTCTTYRGMLLVLLQVALRLAT